VVIDDSETSDERAGELRGLRDRVAELEGLIADRERFRVFFEHAPDAVYLNDAQGVFIDGNPAAVELIGYSKDELVGHSFLDLQLLPAEELPAAALLLTRNLRGENTGPDEFRLRRKDGTFVPVEIITFPVHIEDEVTIVGFVRETSERKRLEEELRQAHKMEALGKLAGGLAHDFNNLLLAITGYSEVLQQQMDLDDPRQDAVQEILKAGEHGAALVRQLLGFSRSQPVSYGAIDLNALIGDTITMLRSMVPEDVEFDVDLAPDVGWVHGDSAQITGVLMNLAINAADSMLGGGKLTIATRGAAAAAEARGGAVDADRYAMLVVSDTGSGMDKATVERIFDPFFTTKALGKGTGMGLSTAYGIVRQHGGEINVRSKLGSGTTFRVYLPASNELAAPVAKPAASAESIGGNEVVLVVEDEDQVRDVVYQILVRRGYEVIQAVGGDEARRKLAVDGHRISLLVTDVVMPGQSGPEVYDEAVAKYPGLKVLFMTGYSDREQAIGSADPLQPLIRKPFGTDELAAAVREALAGSSPAG